MEGGASTCT